MKKILLLLLCAASAAVFPQTLWAEKFDNTIDVGTPGVQKIRIAVPFFAAQDGQKSVNAQEASALTKRFEHILDFTNWFDFLPQSAFAFKKNPALTPFQAQDWAFLKPDVVVLGVVSNATPNSGLFDLELRLYDVKQHSMRVGKRYSKVNKKTVDFALRRFADVVVNALTGVPGPFLSKIAFVGKKEGQKSQIYVADFDGGNAVQITHDSSIHLSPSWSKDGLKVLFTSFATGRPEIYQYHLMTKRLTRLSNGPGNSSGACLSPDGGTIAYASSTPEGRTHIYSVNAFGAQRQELVHFGEIDVEPAYSLDQKYLAFTSNRYGKPMIFIKNLLTGDINRLTYAGWYNASASWQPDGSTVAFASYDRKIDRWDIFKVKSDGSQMERLTLAQGDNEKPSWSPDGRFLVFQSNRSISGFNKLEKASALYVMAKDGSFQKRLATPVEARQPAWGPRLEQLTADDSVPDTTPQTAGSEPTKATHKTVEKSS